LISKRQDEHYLKPRDGILTPVENCERSASPNSQANVDKRRLQYSTLKQKEAMPIHHFLLPQNELNRRDVLHFSEKNPAGNAMNEASLNN